MKRIGEVVVLSFVCSAALLSQNIPIKTVPLATGEQFLLFPSQNLGAGGVSIAFDDPLADPFVNPAKGARLGGLELISAPLYYGVYPQNLSRTGSSGRTLPLGVLFGGKEFFGGVVWARQGLTSEQGNSGFSLDQVSFSALRQPPGRGEYSNNYSFGMLGKNFEDRHLSVGASILLGDLNAMEGVQHLYPRGSNLRQSGSMTEVRLGFFADWEGERSGEAVISYHTVDMKHELTTSQLISGVIQEVRETHLDMTSGWGVKLGYQQPLAGNWRIGGLLVRNRKSHPKIPNYELMNIPRDPGSSSAYQLGVGLVSRGKRALFGIDIIYEPIASETWAEAESPVRAPSGRIIPMGGRTVENFFSFYNRIVRVGVRDFGERVDVQFGVQKRTIKYYLNQINHSLEFRRNLREEWNEWTVSFGIGFPLLGAKLRYTGLITTGTGQPGVTGGTWVAPTNGLDLAASDYVIAPSGPLALNEAWVLTHQLSVVVSIE